jgi:hypothetical protein
VADKTILYQPLLRRPFGAISGTELRGAICYDIRCQESGDQCPKGQWYCENTWCVVRQVTVSLQAFRRAFARHEMPRLPETHEI